MPLALSTRRPRSASGTRPSRSHALWHYLRGISYMPLALSTRRPRSASGTRPSRSHALWHNLRGVSWDPAFCAAAGLSCRSTFNVKAVKTISCNTTPCDSFAGVLLALRQATKIEPHVQDLRVLSPEGANGFQLVASRGCHMKASSAVLPSQPPPSYCSPSGMGEHLKKLFVLFRLGFETRATWLRNNKETSPVLVRL